MPGKRQIIRKLVLFTILVVICWGCLLLPDMISAQKPPKVLVITSDNSVEKYKAAHDAFQETLEQPVSDLNLGDPQWSDPAEVEEAIYDENPDVMYAIGSKAYTLANSLAGQTPVVFSSIVNWRRLPFTVNTYGISNELHVGMELTLFRYVFPEIQQIGVIYSKTYEEWFKNAQQEARGMGVELIGQKISKKQQVQATLKKLLPSIQAFWLISDPEVMSSREELASIFNECDLRKIPMFSYHEAYADFGAVLTVSVDEPTVGRQAASLVTDILAGISLSKEERVQYPAGSSIALNLKVIKAYELPYNEEAVGSATKVIQ
jgi:putative tryptophan/tyrosine transport system substrate-binding protein